MSTIHGFVSYSHRDDCWVKEGPYGLIPWLAQSLRRHAVDIWYDHALKQMPGTEYRKLIQSEIERAHLAILLISQDFVNSEFIQEYELPWIRQRVERGELALIPILVGPTLDEDLDWLADRQMLPGRPAPLIEYIESNAKWQAVRLDILKAIRDRIRELTGPQSSTGRRSSRSSAQASKRKPAVAGSVVPSGWTAKERHVTVARPDSDTEIVVAYCTNTIGMEFVLIPSGEFVAARGIASDGREKPVRKACRVRITEPFYVGAHPITVAAFERFVESTGYRTEGEGPRGARIWTGEHFRYSKKHNWRSPGYDQDGMCPVVCISWNDTREFAKWLSEKESLAYRLPTEAEWEYACRAGTRTRYYWGSDFRTDCAWSGVNSGRRPRPVGQKLPNAFGLYDMSGNVWEWCYDWFSRDYIPAARDPQGPKAGEQRVVRGASWWNANGPCASANRFMQPQSSTGVLGGARIICSPSQ